MDGWLSGIRSRVWKKAFKGQNVMGSGGNARTWHLCQSPLHGRPLPSGTRFGSVAKKAAASTTRSKKATINLTPLQCKKSQAHVIMSLRPREVL